MIRLENVTKRLLGKLVLDKLSLHIKRSETYVILGPSGVGKSVTLKLIIGLMKPDSGGIFIKGEDITAVGRRRLFELRRMCGFLFQSGALINWLNVFDNVALPLREERKLKESEIRDAVLQRLQLVDMEGAGEIMPAQLSGGMKKRVALARAIVTNPDIILYDEPTTGLDPIVGETINRLILRLQEKLGATSVVVTHDLHSAFMVGNRIGLMEEGGKLAAEGAPDELRHSGEPAVRKFIDVTGIDS